MQAAKGRAIAAAVVVLLAGLAGAGDVEASIPRPQTSAELAAWPAVLPDAPALADLELEPAPPAASATTTASPAAVAAGDRFGLFDPGPAAGLFAATRPSARARLEAETRLRVHDLELSVRIGLEPLEVAARTGFTVFGRRETRRGSENRWYDPELGRFISVDPLGYVDGPNLYQYGLNNPISYSDPLGLDTCPDCRVYTKPPDPEMQASAERSVRCGALMLQAANQRFLSLPQDMGAAFMALLPVPSKTAMGAMDCIALPELCLEIAAEKLKKAPGHCSERGATTRISLPTKRV